MNEFRKCEKKKMNSNIEPHKIFVKFLPANITSDKVERMFSICGKVLHVQLISSKIPDYDTESGFQPYLLAFITFDNQNAADRAVLELNGKPMQQGQRLHVTHSLFERKRKDPEKKSAAGKFKELKEYEELCRKCSANEEKINRIYNRPEEEEIKKLINRKNELKDKQNELKKTNESLKEEIKNLQLKVKIKNLDMENSKLRA